MKSTREEKKQAKKEVKARKIEKKLNKKKAKIENSEIKKSERAEARKKTKIYKRLVELKSKIDERNILIDRENVRDLEKIMSRSGVSFHETYYVSANQYWTCYEIHEFSTNHTKPFMFDKLNAFPDSILSIDYSHVLKNDYNASADKIINKSDDSVNDSKKFSNFLDNSEVMKQNIEFYKHIRSTGQSVKNISVRVYLYADTLDRLEKQKVKLLDLFKDMEVKGYIQINDLISYYKGITNFSNTVKTMVASENLTDMIMFKELNKINPLASPIGITVKGVYCPDFFNFENSSYSIAVMGATGSGKSAITKLILEDMILKDDIVQILDIHHEYDLIAKRYGLANPQINENTNINLCQIYSLSDLKKGVIRDVDIMTKISLITTTIAELNEINMKQEFTMMNLFHDLVYDQLAKFKGLALNEIKNDEWCVLSDIYDYLLEKKEKKEFENEALQDVYKLEGILKKTIKGFGFLYNNKTNIDVDLNQSIVFDISFLKSEQSTSIKGSYLTLMADFLSKAMNLNEQYNQLQEQEQNISLSKHERSRPFRCLMQIFDEFGQYLDNRPFLKQIELSVMLGRKSYAGIMIIMHTTENILKSAEQNGDLITSIFNLCVNKILGNVDGTAVEKLPTLVNCVNTRDCVQLSQLTKGKHGEREFLIVDSNNVKYWVTSIVTNSQKTYFKGGA